MLDLPLWETAFVNLSFIQLIVATIILFVASIIRGLTGFGFSAILVTGLSFVLPPAQTVIIALLLEIAASVHLLPSVWKKIDWVLLRALGVGVIVGTPIGVSLLAWLDPDLMRLLISCMVLVFALLLFFGFVYRGPRTLPVHGGLGFVSGLCNGTAALGGLPIVTFLLSTDASVAATRATLIAAFFGTDLFALFFARGHGLLNGTVMVYAISAVPILIVGVGIGHRLFHIASPELFRKLAIVLLLGLSMAGIVRSAFTLLYSS
jgi:uncharacterized membrane protein YfcA